MAPHGPAANYVTEDYSTDDEYEEWFASEIIALLPASSLPTSSGYGEVDETEEAMTPSLQLGVAEGLYARDLPCTGVFEAFQADARGKTGRFWQMVADVAAMGGGRIRRVKQGDGYWACTFPYNEADTVLYEFGRQVMTPSEIVRELRAVDETSGEPTFLPFAASTSLLVACLCFGVKLDLSVLNAGGGPQLNWSPADSGGAGTGYIPLDSLHTTIIPWSDVVDARPRWQKGVLCFSGEGWDSFYYNDADLQALDGYVDPSSNRYSQFALNIWPTVQGDSGISSTAYELESRRRKALAVAAFGHGLGEWLYRVGLALAACTDGTCTLPLSTVVDTLDISSELNQYWFASESDGAGARSFSASATGPVSAQDIENGAQEVGRYMALLAGPIHAWVPEVRFRMDLETWIPSGRDSDNYADELAWARLVLESGMAAEVARWSALDASRSAPSPPAEEADWYASEAAAGFQWPQAPLGLPLPAVGELMHDLGVNWYHGYNREPDGGRFDQGYADATRVLQDVQDLSAAIGGMPSFTLTMVVGEIAFPAIDPTEAGKPPNGARYYLHTSQALQAAMHLRILCILLSQGVHAGFAYTYVFGPSTSYAAWPVGAYCGWVQSAATGVRNDILYDPRAGCDEPATRDYMQGLDCWPRPVWYTYRRLAWLLARADRIALTNDADSGLTIAKFVLREPLSAGPDGEPLRRSWSNFYVVWVDQTRFTNGPVTVAFGYSAPEWADGLGVALDGGLFERLNLFPWIDPDTIAGNVDARGFALPVVDWSSANWRPFEALASRPSARPNPYRSVEGYTRILLMDIQPCNPEDASSTALAPLCFFTNTSFFRILG